MLENENNIIDSENVDETVEATQEVVDKTPKKKEKEKKPKSKVRRVLNWVVTGVFGVLIAFSAAIMIYSRVGGDGFIGNVCFMQVLTDSMADVYPVDSVLIIEKVDPADIKVGDNVTFKYDITPSNGLDDKVNMTHQISYIAIDDEWETGKGHYKFTAHGTNKKSEFCKVGGEYGDCTNQLQHFREMDLVGRVKRVSPVLTIFYKIVKTPIGLITLILIPCLYLMVTSVIDIFKKLPDDEEETSNAGASSGSSTGDYKPKVYAPGENPLAGMSEEDKERLKKQLLDEMLGKGGKK